MIKGINVWHRIFDFGQLTCQGLNRSLALPQTLVNKYGKPNYIFAPNPYWGGVYYYVRGLVSIEPTAVFLNMPVQAQYPFSNYVEMTNELLTPKFHQSLLFVSWEHIYLVKMVKNMMKELKADSDLIPHWPERDFDSIYFLKIDWGTNPPTVTFKHDHQNLDGQSDVCPIPTRRLAKKRDERLMSAQYVFVPTAESFSANVDQLTCQGLNRALALMRTLESLYPTIDCFVLPSAENDRPRWENCKSNFIRALMTIEPTLIFRGGLFLPVSRTHRDVAVRAIKSSIGLKQVAVITWPIEDIALLAREFYALNGGDANEIPNPMPNINTLYQITINLIGSTPKPEFKIILENIESPSKVCPSPNRA